MTAKELISTLKKVKPTTLIVLSRDSEGNGFSPIRDVSADRYTPDPKTPWYIDPEGHGTHNCLILWPT